MFAKAPVDIDWILEVGSGYSDRVKTQKQLENLTREIANRPAEYKIGLLANLWAETMRSGIAASKETYKNWGVETLGMSPDDIAKAFTATNSTPSADPSSLTLEQRGESMAGLFRLMGIRVSFIGPVNDSARHYCMNFKLEPGVKFSALKSALHEVASYGGFDPKLPIQVLELPGLVAQLYVPKWPKDWRTINLITFLSNRYGVSETDIDKRVYRLMSLLTSAKKSGLVKVPVGFSVQNEAIDIEILSGVRIIGGTRSGKSNAQKAMISYLLLAYAPADLGLALVDMKNVTFTRYRNLGCLVHPVVNGDNFDVEYPRMKLAIDAEYDRRNAQLGGDGPEDWVAYERVTGKKMKPIFIFFDEVKRALVRDELLMEWMIKAASTYAHAGIFLILGTQYGTTLVPELRENMGATVGFRMGENASKYAFSSKNAQDMADCLAGMGDGAIEASNLPYCERVLCYCMPDPHRDAVIKQYQEFHPHPAQFLPVPEPPPEPEESNDCPACGAIASLTPHGPTRRKCSDCQKTFSAKK